MDMKDVVFLILFAVFIIWSIWGIRKVNKDQNDFNRIFEKIAELKNYAEITQREHRKQFLDFMIGGFSSLTRLRFVVYLAYKYTLKGS